MATQEYDINDLLKNIKSSNVSASGAKEYDINELLIGLKPYKAPSITAEASATPNNILKGAEFFARNPIGSKAINSPFMKDVGKGVASALDNTIGSVIPSAVGYVTQAAVRPFSSPERSAEIAQNISGAIDKPFGKAFGITDDPVYKQEATQRLNQFIGENMDKGADYLAKQTGLPKEDIANMMNSAAIYGGAKSYQIGKPIVKNAITDVQNQFDQAKANLQREPTQPVTASGAPGTAPITTKAVEVLDPATGQPVVMATDGAPPVSPVIEAVAPNTRNIAVLDENPPRPTTPATPENVSYKEQVLRDVGLEDIRQSALTGDPLEASSQYITSKADKGTYAQGMRNQIELEKNTLNNYFGSVESELGGTVPRRGSSFEVSDEMGRGKIVKDSLESAQQGHKAKTDELYNKASQEVGAIPVELIDLKSYLDKKSNFVSSPEKSLRNGIDDYLSEQGLLNENQTVKPMTVGQSELLRKFINKQYNYETKGSIGELVNRIDDDVFRNVKGDTYEQARAHFKAGKEIYDNPKAIKDLLSDEGVNQKIADEKVINKIANIDESQFGHLMTTLRETGKTEAIKEIQTALVNRVKEAGRSEVTEPWNARAAAKERAKLSQKLNVAFSDNPQLLDKIDKGIEAGNILYVPNKYPGAAIQSNLLNNKFADFVLQKGPTAVGEFFGGPAGAVGGQMIGERLSGAANAGRQRSLLKKEIKQKGTPINEVDEFKIKD